MYIMIYYFSGTGNNLYIAKQIAKNLTNTVICPISNLEENKVIPEQFDWIGYVVPSYYSHIPPYVKSCMEQGNQGQKNNIQIINKKKNLKPRIFYKKSSEERLRQSIAAYTVKGKEYKVNDQCMACIQWCSQRAIYHDEKEMERKRYHHPKR